MTTQPKLQLEWKQYMIFRAKWVQGEYSGLRYGQAFHAYFRLDKISVNKIEYDRLYQAHAGEALGMIESLFEFN